MSELLRLLHGEIVVAGPFHFRLTPDGLHIANEHGFRDDGALDLREISVTAARQQLDIRGVDEDRPTPAPTTAPLASEPPSRGKAHTQEIR